MKLNDNIKNFRTFRNITQQSLADLLGKTKSVISNWERGENSPDIESVEKMCKIFNVTPNELFGWDDNEEYCAWLKQKNQLGTELVSLKLERDAIEQRIAEMSKRLSELNGE